MARNTVDSASDVAGGDAEVNEGDRHRSSASVTKPATQPGTVKNACAQAPVFGATTISFGAKWDQTANPETGDWFEQFPVEDGSQAPGDPARVQEIGSTGSAGSADTLIPFGHSSSATASHFVRGVRPPKLIVPSLFVDARNVRSNLASPASPTTMASSRRRRAAFPQLMTWLRTASRRLAVLTLWTLSWLKTTSQRLATLTLGTLAWLRTMLRRLALLTLGTMAWLRSTTRRLAMWTRGTMARLRSASRRPAALTLGTHKWLHGRGAWVLGGLACLALAGPSALNQFSSPADTSGDRDFAIAAAPEVPVATVPVSQSSSLESAPSSRVHAPSPVSVASSAKVTPGAAQSTRKVAQPPVARSSPTLKSKELPTTPPISAVIVGTLVVTSTPAGANVFMNRRHVGKTPLETSVKAGSYAVLLELDGARWTDVVLVRADRVTRLEPQLIPRR